VTCSPEALYRDTRKAQNTFNLTAKTAPNFAPSGWRRDVTPIQRYCSSLRSLSNAYTLYCRAVNWHTTHIFYSIKFVSKRKILVNFGQNTGQM
jgi:hypothetical protein